MILYEEVLKAFQKKKVKYLLVGGIAFNLHGGYRNTLDMDILVELTENNLKKIIDILKDKGYKVKLPIDPMKILDIEVRADWINNRNLKAINFYKNSSSYEEVDIIVDSPVTFKKAYSKAKKIRTAGLTLPVISINDLILMKEASGRSHDLQDIRELKELKRLSK